MAELIQSIGEIAVHDENFDVSKGENYTLSVLLSAGEVTCAVHDRIENRFIALCSRKVLSSGLENALITFEKLKKDVSWMGAGFRKSTITFVDRNFTLVPSGLFDASKKEDYMNLSCLAGNTEEINHLPLSSINAVVVWRQAAAFSRQQGPGVKILHQACVSIDAVISMNKNKQGKKVYVFIHKGSLEIIVISGHALVLYNIFDFQNTDELVYHVMNVYESLQLNPENIPVVLSGDIDKNSAAYGLLYKYIRHVDMLVIPENLSFSYKISELNPGRFFGLFSQVQCVS